MYEFIPPARVGHFDSQHPGLKADGLSALRNRRSTCQWPGENRAAKRTSHRTGDNFLKGWANLFHEKLDFST